MIHLAIKSLVEYGLNHQLIQPSDTRVIVNRLLEIMQLDAYENSTTPCLVELEPILALFLDNAIERGIIDDSQAQRDLLDTKLMGVLTPMPHEILERFWGAYRISPKDATDYYYALAKATDYIRSYRIQKDIKWKTATRYGTLDITINLAKPEKDPKDIIAQGRSKSSGYPRCLLCVENEGYAGRANHPPRQNHRLIPVTLNGEQWFFQYSPYVYYNEHCILLNGEHIPMKIGKATFRRLLDFVRQFPHYFLGSNADLPIVGGSILSHDHFQGGCYEFPMARAENEFTFTIQGFPQILAEKIKWPMYTLRLTCDCVEPLVDCAAEILEQWRSYSDESAGIYACTQDTPHNTVTPIARRKGKQFQLDLVLRNNLTTPLHPDGVYHPHREKHHIKKENIGLIEVMGLAVLPSRLKSDFDFLRKALLNPALFDTIEQIAAHREWAEAICKNRQDITDENVDNILREEIGQVFLGVLEDSGVFKDTDSGKAAGKRFLCTLGSSY